MTKLERDSKEWKLEYKKRLLRNILVKTWLKYIGQSSEGWAENTRIEIKTSYIYQYILSPEEEPGLHTTSYSKMSQPDWWIFI